MAGAALAELIALGGAGLSVSELSGGAEAPHAPGPGVVRIGVHRHGVRPSAGLEPFDILISADASAPIPWVGCEPETLDATLQGLCAAIERQPGAAAVAAQVFRATLALAFDQALALESLAYSMLLASAGFQAWRAANPARRRDEPPGPRVRIEPQGEAIAIRLARPAARNAFDAAMRDELCEALAFVRDHPDAPPVILCGEGPAFSAGGDLAEFGTAKDPAEAHLIRTLRSPARLAHDLGDRLTARLHGACVGAGIEVPAAAARVIALDGAFFRLPEVTMGLIPGAGGTATIPRRIGRHRACYLTISGVDLDLATALAWKLVDDRVAP
ncbi:MAG TPA: enoyl-CoA hydratase/isomerase family protein [Phenylobacterium sp.]|uniref:enoyl-CoA hydratase/isomerase family protein n=1 Tax=Phenylobacterium sp. TaxID=1871053 RepID=UPI002CB14C2E|nr:enoyl-CoA hydratase/isomerase family protein [Phenylobacterium sp.]HSV03304.1 enoyl-CoA hydratase/isomerase family protein [Phenylobacterium sp.]